MRTHWITKVLGAAVRQSLSSQKKSWVYGYGLSHAWRSASSCIRISGRVQSKPGGYIQHHCEDKADQHIELVLRQLQPGVAVGCHAIAAVPQQHIAHTQKAPPDSFCRCCGCQRHHQLPCLRDLHYLHDVSMSALQPFDIYKQSTSRMRYPLAALGLGISSGCGRMCGSTNAPGSPH